MKGGISYKPNEDFLINLELEKDLGFKESIKSGIEYQVVSNVYLRTGFSTQPFVSAFGIGFHPQKLLFDYSFSNDSDLGNVHECSFAISIE